LPINTLSPLKFIFFAAETLTESGDTVDCFISPRGGGAAFKAVVPDIGTEFCWPLPLADADVSPFEPFISLLDCAWGGSVGHL
jgi:hypothetical protein